MKKKRVITDHGEKLKTVTFRIPESFWKRFLECRKAEIKGHRDETVSFSVAITIANYVRNCESQTN